MTATAVADPEDQGDKAPPVDRWAWKRKPLSELIRRQVAEQEAIVARFEARMRAREQRSD